MPRGVLDLTALLETCATFDPSDMDQRVVMSDMVVSILTRNLVWSRIAARVSPGSESIQSIVVQIEEAIRLARIGLNGRVESRASEVDETQIAAAGTASMTKPSGKQKCKAPDLILPGGRAVAGGK